MRLRRRGSRIGRAVSCRVVSVVSVAALLVNVDVRLRGCVNVDNTVFISPVVASYARTLS